MFLDSPTGFTVDAKSVTPNGEGKVRAIVTSPSGQRTESIVKNNNDGTYDVLYTPYEQGEGCVGFVFTGKCYEQQLTCKIYLVKWCIDGDVSLEMDCRVNQMSFYHNP